MGQVISLERIKREAREAILHHSDVITACPYPFDSAAALAFAEAFEREREALATQDACHG